MFRSMMPNGGRLRWMLLHLRDRRGAPQGFCWLALLLACSPHPYAGGAPAGLGDAASASASPRVHSNIQRADYAGSQRCADCHTDIYEHWQHSPMHRMTRQVETADVRAPFDGTLFHLGAASARVEQRNGRDFMEIQNERGTRLYRVTRVIGGRYREDFAGVDVSIALHPETDRGQGRERVLPISFVYSTASWRYKGYSVMLPERPSLHPGPVWSETCIGCHNTLPYLTLLYDDLFGPGAPKYQGSVADHLAVTPRSWTPIIEDESGLGEAIGAEETALGGTAQAAAAHAPLKRVLVEAIDTTRQRLDGDHLVELGVGCESCHGGSREHAEDPRLAPSFNVESPYFGLRSSAGTPTRAEAINHTCARCHTVLFSRYPWTWEGGRRQGADPGGSSTNSGEGRDFLLGGCSNQMSCTTCHDPHAEDRRQRLDQLATVLGNPTCTSCHEQYVSEAGLLAHTHHGADSTGSACVGCHMPRKNMGLDYQLTRYHRIGSPTDESRVLGDRPLECALCHADQSVERLVAQMESWWGKSYDRAALEELYGPNLNIRAIDSTLQRGKPHEQAVAIAVLGDQKRRSALPLLVPELTHAYPLVRFYAKAAIERIIGRALPIDVNAAVEQIHAEGDRWLTALAPHEPSGAHH
jgi:predicted CXXCH cytochrome family protein